MLVSCLDYWECIFGSVSLTLTSGMQDDAQQKALHVFLENTHLQLLQHTNTFRETATSKMDEYLNNLPRHVLNEVCDMF